MIEARYDLGGHVLAVAGREPRLLADVEAMLGAIATGAEAAPSFRIEVRRDTVEAAGGGDLIFEGEVPEDGRCVMHRIGEKTHVAFPGQQTLTVTPSLRRAEIRVSPNTGSANWTLWMLALDAAIDACGQTLIHAAGLGLPGADTAVLLHAPSGVGKTTASLALAAAGFGLLSDDGVIIGRQDRSWTGWGLPRAVKIHSRTAAMLPIFNAALGPKWDRNGEQAVPLGLLNEIIRVERPSPRRLVGIFQLERAADGRSSATMAGRAETFAALAEDNVRTGRQGLPPGQQRRMSALAGLVSSVPLFRLASGDDLHNLGDLVLSALRGHDLPQ